jgi:signal transduction histidine kinase
MELDRSSISTKALILGVSFMLAALVGYVDIISSVYIAFSIFYLIPVFLTAWFVDQRAAIGVAVACGFAGLLADLVSLHDLGADLTFAFVNLGLRLVLFITFAILLSYLRRAVDREQEVADREREASERLLELNEMKDRLMRSVVIEAREPLGDIYARIVSLGFDMPNLTTNETREVLSEIADASRRLSTLVNTLLDEERLAAQAEPRPEAGAEPRELPVS